MSYTWTFVNLTIHAPFAREQHASAVVNGDLYVFGGKAREFPSSADTVFNDIWKLEVHTYIIYLIHTYIDRYMYTYIHAYIHT